jgi:hypothetical protein
VVRTIELTNKRTRKHNLQEFNLRSGLSIKARMSSTRQAVIFGPNLIGCGNRFDLTPAHHVLLDTGIGPLGAMIFLSRMNPVSGRQTFVVGDFDWVIGPSASNTFIVSPLFRNQKPFSTKSIWFMRHR